MSQSTTLILDLTPIVERLDRLEQRIATTTNSAMPMLLRAAAALKLFGGSKAQFYRLVDTGEIERVNFGDADHPGDSLYDAESIRRTIARHKTKLRAKR